jgi:farnesyl-diphosphate farnesyltransferase
MLALLRGVSRSFYLSIRLLPAPLRRPIAVGYLLARAADTLADTADLPASQRMAHLKTWAGAVDGRVAEAEVTALSASFAPLQHDAAERQLIIALPACLAWLDDLAPADREDVRAVLRHITRGQSLDVERFEQASAPRALDSAAQLDEYTYLVAGCVGEFWTELCFRHLPDFATLAKSEMRELGRGYGMGLQLVNILRDADADRAAGRCYLPEGESRAAWLAKAQAGLAMGMRYADAVNSRRVRAASALPALLGARTLSLLQAAGPQGTQKVKMPRREVYAVMARLALTLAGRSALRSQFDRLRG